MAYFLLAGIVAAVVQALTFAGRPRTAPDSPVFEVLLWLFGAVSVFLTAWAASFRRPARALPAAAGAVVGTILVWVEELIRHDSQEVGTFGAALEGVLIGAAIALPGAALFLLVQWRLGRSRP